MRISNRSSDVCSSDLRHTLPADDARSRAIVEAMKADEARHADNALNAGARTLPTPIPQAMAMAANVMKWIGYRAGQALRFWPRPGIAGKRECRRTAILHERLTKPDCDRVQATTPEPKND